MCGVHTDGASWCWGRGDRGNRGIGAIPAIDFSSASPLAVPGGVSFASIDVANLRTFRLSTTGRAFCWGDYQFGNIIGNGSVAGSYVLTPAAVMKPLDESFCALSSGDLYGPAIGATSNAIYRWGSDQQGEPGTGNRNDTNALDALGAARC